MNQDDNDGCAALFAVGWMVYLIWQLVKWIGAGIGDWWQWLTAHF